jgi:ABC-type antimicrobial peptide transport system permease subunit
VAVTLLITSAIVGVENNFISEISSQGVDWIYVSPNQAAVYPLNQSNGVAIANKVPDISAVAPVMWVGLSVPGWGEQNLIGTNESIQPVFSYQVVAGSFNLSWNGNPSAPIPVVLGYSEWTNYRLSVGQQITGTVYSLSAGGGSISSVTLIVAGLLAPRGSLSSTNLDTMMFVSVAALTYVTSSPVLTYIFVAAADSQYVSQVSNSITALLTKLHGGYTDFSVDSELSWVAFVQTELSQFQSIISLVEFTLLILSAMSVFVVMTMAVKDRRREIGVMRAIGARRGDVMGQFLLEAGLMSVTGMVIGVFLGTALATYLKAHGGGFYSSLLTNPLDLGFYFAELLGILWGIGFLFSMVPAYQASRLEAVEALKSL